jgi:hypoxia up-regulated 1
MPSPPQIFSPPSKEDTSLLPRLLCLSTIIFSLSSVSLVNSLSFHFIMAPPGRRRLSASLLGMLFTLLLLAHSACAQSAVLGIDLGTEYIKAALVKPGTPLEIVLAKDSKRQEASVVSFKPLKKGQIPDPEGPMPERSYGSAAIALAGRFPGDTYPNLKQLLGLPADSSSVVDRYEQRYPALRTKKADFRGTVAFQSPSFPPKERPFAVEELLAMELKNTIQNAQLMAGKAYKVSSAVFTIPPFYTTEEKAALELAAELAKIKVLAVITDGLAVGVNYATSRTFPSVSEGAKPEIHMVYDVGAGYTSATVLKMQSRTVKDIGKFNKTIQEVIVLGSGWDRTLGGDALNDLIVEDMATKFLETSAGKALGKTVKDVLSHGRASTRLWKDAERVRQVLSANQETSASFEELYEGVDFRYKLSRPNFEAMSTSIAERLDAPFTNALKMANVTVADLDSVIMHGGAIRTPFVQKRLEGLAGDASKLRSNVNSLEAAVFGAAFKAASVSPSFRVKDIRANDAATYPTWMQYRKDKEGKTTQQKIFSSSTFTGATKVYTLPKLEDFEIYLFQNRPTDKGSPYEAGKSGVSGSRFMSVNLTESVNKLVELGCKTEDVTTQVTVKLDSVWGLPLVHSGSVSCEHEVVEPKGVIDGVKDFLGFGKKEEGAQKVIDNENESTESSSSATPTESSSTSDSSSSASKSTSSATEKDKPKEPSKPKQKTETLDFSFSVTHEPTTVVPYTEQKFMAER